METTHARIATRKRADIRTVSKVYNQYDNDALTFNSQGNNNHIDEENPF